MNDAAPPEIPPAPRSVLRRIGRGLLIYVVIPYAAVLLFFTLFQRRFLYPAGHAAALPAAEAPLPAGQAHDLTLAASDGLTLHGWLILADGQTADSEAEWRKRLAAGGRLVLYFPGNAGHRGERTSDFLDLTRLGLHVVIFDYRGYGDNAGRPSESALINDARRVWDYITNDLSVPHDRVIVFGESLGGGVAIQTAAAACRDGTPPAALILSSTFSSLAETAATHFPMFPVRLVLFDRYSSNEHLPDITCPLLMFHGTADEFVPLANARRLFAVAPRQSTDGIDKAFVELPGGTHNAIPVQRLSERIRGLLERLGKG